MTTREIMRRLERLLKSMDVGELLFNAACNRQDARLLFMEEQLIWGPRRKERRGKGVPYELRDDEELCRAVKLLRGDTNEACRKDHETMVNFCMNRYGSTCPVDRRWAWGGSYKEIWDYFFPRFLDYHSAMKEERLF